MPRLLSRMDDTGWLTPAIADVLDELPSIPHDEQFRRDQALTIQQRLAELGTPVRIVRIGVSPSWTLFVLQPGEERQRGSRQKVSAEGIARRLPHVQRALEAEAVGIVPELRPGSEQIGILVRMPDHHRLRLRELLLSPTFQSMSASTTLALGLGLDQRSVVRDLAALPHLLLVGKTGQIDASVHSLLLTLVLFNTPAEVRFALMRLGADEQSSTSAMETFAQLPHVLGQRLRTPEESLRLLDGMLKECERRKQLFSTYEAVDLAAYNARVRGQAENVLPRIVVVMDNLLAADWLSRRDQWLTTLGALLEEGGAAGIHLLAAADLESEGRLPDALAALFPVRMVALHAAARRWWPYRVPFPRHFADAFVASGNDEAEPLAFGQVSEREIVRVVDYWVRAAKHRPAMQQSAFDQVEPSAEELPEAPARHIESEAPSEPEAEPALPSPAALRRVAEALTPQDVKLARAGALAAYLGWLGVGPLHDVLGMSEEEAAEVLEHLQMVGVLETGSGPTWRFARLDRGEGL